MKAAGVFTTATNGFESTDGSAAALAKFDARATAAQTAAHTIFEQSGGDLNIFYTSSSWAPTYIWSLTDEIFNLTTPLFKAVSAIDVATVSIVTLGNAISPTAATTLAYGSQLFSENNYNAGISDNGAIGFVPLISAVGNYQINLMVDSSSAGKFVRVLLDGQTFGSGALSVPVSDTAANVFVGTTYLTAGQHGLIVEGQYASNNDYSDNSCGFTSVKLTPVSAETYSQWTRQYFTASQRADASVSGMNSEPQGDGIPNLLKYLLDINPSRPMTQADHAALPLGGTMVVGGQSYLTLTYRRSSLTASITANVQTSADLLNWTTVSNPNIVQTGTDAVTGDPILQVQVLATGTQEFIRLNVTST